MQQVGVLRGLVNSNFPAKVERGVQSEIFTRSVTEACNDLNLIPTPLFIEKVWQLYETLLSRNGAILLGATLAGKSTLFRILARIYPKIVSLTGSGDEYSVFSYRFDVMSGHWSLRRDNLIPRIPPNFEAHLLLKFKC